MRFLMQFRLLLVNKSNQGVSQLRSYLPHLLWALQRRVSHVLFQHDSQLECVCFYLRRWQILEWNLLCFL